MGTQYPAAKVILNKEVLIDVTNTTATPTEIAKGFKIVSATGAEIEGTLKTQLYIAKIYATEIAKLPEGFEPDWYASISEAQEALLNKADELLLRDGDFLVTHTYYNHEDTGKSINLVGDYGRSTYVYVNVEDEASWIAIGTSAECDSNTMQNLKGKISLKLPDATIGTNDEYIPYLDKDKKLQWKNSSTLLDSIKAIETFFADTNTNDILDGLDAVNTQLDVVNTRLNDLQTEDKRLNNIVPLTYWGVLPLVNVSLQELLTDEDDRYSNTITQKEYFNRTPIADEEFTLFAITNDNYPIVCRAKIGDTVENESGNIRFNIPKISENIQVYGVGAKGKGVNAETFNGLSLNAAAGDYSHAEGLNTTATGRSSHAEGESTEASGLVSHVEGYEAEASNSYSHAEGYYTVASGEASHAEGYMTTASGEASHAEGYNTIASGAMTHAEGYGTIASQDWSHAEGYGTTASGYEAHAEGLNTVASEAAAHAEGGSTTAAGYYSHAEGYGTVVNELAEASHAEGYETTAYGSIAHAEGYTTAAKGTASHTEGEYTEAVGEASHAEGYHTLVAGNYSHTEGSYTIATGEAQHVQGKYNIEDTENTYAHIVGNGTDGNPSNAHTLDWEGNAWFAGDVYVGSASGTNKDTGSKKLATEECVPLQYKITPSLDNITYAALLTAIQTEDGYTNALVDNTFFNRPPILNERFSFTANTTDDRVVLCYATVTELNIEEKLEGGGVRYNTGFKIKGAADVDLITDIQEKERATSAEEALAAAIAAESSTREAGDKDLGQQLTTMDAAIAGHTQSINNLSQSVDGLGNILENNYYSKSEVDNLMSNTNVIPNAPIATFSSANELYNKCLNIFSEDGDIFNLGAWFLIENETGKYQLFVVAKGAGLLIEDYDYVPTSGDVMMGSIETNVLTTGTYSHFSNYGGGQFAMSWRFYCSGEYVSSEDVVTRDENGDILVPDFPTSGNAAIGWEYARTMMEQMSLQHRPAIVESTVDNNDKRDELLQSFIDNGYGGSELGGAYYGETVLGPYGGDHVKITVTSTGLTHVYYYHYVKSKLQGDTKEWIEICQYNSNANLDLTNLKTAVTTQDTRLKRLEGSNGIVSGFRYFIDEAGVTGGIELMPVDCSDPCDFVLILQWHNDPYNENKQKRIYFKGDIKVCVLLKDSNNQIKEFVISGHECSQDGAIKSPYTRFVFQLNDDGYVEYQGGLYSIGGGENGRIAYRMFNLY